MQKTVAQFRISGQSRSVAAGLLLGFFGLFATFPSAHAQVLNDKVNSLLANNCAQLLQGAGSAVLGPNLAAACTASTGVTGSGASAGGGATAVQTNAASILNRNILSRMEDVQNEQDSSKKSASSMAMNPFGFLAPGMIRGFGAQTPVNPAGDASGASFAASSQSRMKGFGFFASGLVEALNRDVTTFQDGYKSMILGITAGMDYRFNRQTVGGLAINYANTHGDFKNGGDFNTNTIGATLFGSYLPTDQTFVQVTGGYSRNNYLVSRVAQAFIPAVGVGQNRSLAGTPSSNSNGDIFRATLLTGYDHPIGRFTIGPRAGLNWTNTHISDFSETSGGGLGLRYNDQWVNSLQSVLGVQAQAAISTGLGVIVPQANADYIHEFANSQRHIDVAFVEDNRANPVGFRFQTDVPVRNFFNLGTGLIMVLPNGWQPFVNFRAMVGNTQFNNYAGTFGLRIEL
jgi:uncharacterized protein YhjY with autotransporter beta-barrel domain